MRITETLVRKDPWALHLMPLFPSGAPAQCLSPAVTIPWRSRSASWRRRISGFPPVNWMVRSTAPTAEEAARMQVGRDAGYTAELPPNTDCPHFSPPKVLKNPTDTTALNVPQVNP